MCPPILHVVYLFYILPVDNSELRGESAIWVLYGRMTGWKRRKDKLYKLTKKGKRKEVHNKFFFRIFL